MALRPSESLTRHDREKIEVILQLLSELPEEERENAFGKVPVAFFPDLSLGGIRIALETMDRMRLSSIYSTVVNYCEYGYEG